MKKLVLMVLMNCILLSSLSGCSVINKVDDISDKVGEKISDIDKDKEKAKE